MTAVTSTTTDQHHPVVDAQKSDRAAVLQLRVADAITKFAGSMRFVYFHIVAFAAWMLRFTCNRDGGKEQSPKDTQINPPISLLKFARRANRGAA